MRKSVCRRCRCAAPKMSVCVALVALVSTLAGCGNAKLGSVSGKVTLDDQPLAGAQVSFMPVNGGGASFGETDSAGQYSLTHTSGSNGATVGNHTVSIVVEDDEEPYDESGSDEQGRLRITKNKVGKVPDRYNEQTELTAEVKAGENTFDFPLKSNP